MQSFQGEFMDGRSAAVMSVSVTFDGLFLIGRASNDGRELLRWELVDVRADAIQERDIVHLQTRADPDALLTIRGAAIESLRTLGVSGGGLPARAASRFGFALACVAGIAAFSASVWVSATPVSKAVARRIPIEVERELMGGLERRLSKGYCDSEAASSALADLGRRLLGEAGELPPAHIVNLSIPNAFALPGGTVLLTRGLTDLAESSDEVAGVLAHELEHVRQRHVMAGFVRGTLLSALWAVSVGDYAGLMVIDPTTAFQIATLEFSRADEAEADVGAVAMLERARIDSDGLSRFFERLEEEAGEVPEWLSSHPPAERRAAATESAMDEGAQEPALSGEQWLAVKQACEDAPAPAVGLRDLFL